MKRSSKFCERVVRHLCRFSFLITLFGHGKRISFLGNEGNVLLYPQGISKLLSNFCLYVSPIYLCFISSPVVPHSWRFNFLTRFFLKNVQLVAHLNILTFYAAHSLPDTDLMILRSENFYFLWKLLGSKAIRFFVQRQSLLFVLVHACVFVCVNDSRGWVFLQTCVKAPDVI